jgi:geranylgeranyl diphosphate synthase type II
MKVQDRLGQKKKLIDKELTRLLSQEDSLLFQAMRHAVLSGGKRFRPLLTISSGECFGLGEDVLLPFACSLELIHNYSLIHDDLPLMDNDDFRRGKPSCHKAFGEDIALLAGDSLLTLAFEILAQAPVDEKLVPRKGQVIEEISHFAGARGMVGGQLMDITLSSEKISEEELQELVLKKTGALIIASVRTGAILGEASTVQLEAVVEYGRNIGIAFQIRDDILDLTNEKKNEPIPRPSHVSLYGLAEAKKRLKRFVEEGIRAFDNTSLESEELRYLALRLLDINRKENEQNS